MTTTVGVYSNEAPPTPPRKKNFTVKSFLSSETKAKLLIWDIFYTDKRTWCRLKWRWHLKRAQRDVCVGVHRDHLHSGTGEGKKKKKRATTRRRSSFHLPERPSSFISLTKTHSNHLSSPLCKAAVSAEGRKETTGGRQNAWKTSARTHTHRGGIRQPLRDDPLHVDLLMSRAPSFIPSSSPSAADALFDSSALK